MKMIAALFVIMASSLEPALASPLRSDQAIQQASEKAEWEKDLAELKATEPLEYERLRAVWTLVFHQFLARLGYIAGPFDTTASPELIDAIKRYESNRGLPVTGNLMSFDTYEMIKRDTEALDREPLALPIDNVFVDRWDQGYAAARGTWGIVGGTVAFPEQTSRLRCNKTNMQCIEATATVNRSGASAGLLSVDITDYDIASWDHAEIVTVPSDAVCARLVLRINRVSKSVTSFRTKLSNEGVCEGMSDPVNAALVNGFDVWRRLKLEHTAHWERLIQLSPAARRLLDEGKR